MLEAWYVYIVCCSDGSLYTGIAKNVPERVAQHNNHNTLAAKYTRGRRPVTLVYKESLKSRSEAAKRECEIKRMNRQKKQALLTSATHTVKKRLTDDRR